MTSAAFGQYQSLIAAYNKLLPSQTFPWVPFIIAACFQVFAWFGGRFLSNLTLVPRIFILWFYALGEYTFQSPAMNAATEVLHMSESVLIVIYQVVTLVVFTIINTFVFKNPFKVKYIISYVLLSLAVYIAYLG